MSERAKERSYKIIPIIFALLIGLFSLVNMSFKETIQRDVVLDIYENGVIVGRTEVHIDGQRVEFLLGELFEQEDSFVGRFAIDLAERTCNEHTSVQILWKVDPDYQTISFFRAGNIMVNEFGVNHVMLINPTMTEMAIQMGMVECWPVRRRYMICMENTLPIMRPTALRALRAVSPNFKSDNSRVHWCGLFYLAYGDCG